MSEFDDDSKITRLPFPASRHAPDEAGRVLDQVSRMLAEAESSLPRPDPEPQWLPARVEPPTYLAPAPMRGPEPGHRNAIICPQCDKWAWRATRDCWHCEFNLFEFERQNAIERQRHLREIRQRDLSYWAFGLSTGGIAAILLASKVPTPFGALMTVGGLGALFGAYVCSKLIDKQ